VILIFSTVASGKPLDRITVDGDRITYETGAAEAIVRSIRSIMGDEWLDAATDWSNGYVVLREAEPTSVTAARALAASRALESVLAGYDPGQPRDREGRWTDGAGGAALDPDGPVTLPGSSGPAVQGEDAYRAAPSYRTAAERAGEPGWDNPLEQAQHSYAGGASDRWNPWLRTGQGDVREEDLAKMRLLDDAIDASTITQDAVLWRGMRKATRLFTQEQLAESLVGAEWTDEGYTSTSANPDVAVDFANMSRAADVSPVALRLLTPAGTKGMSLGSWGYEAEVLLGRGTRFRVVADHGADESGFRRLDVEVIQGRPAPLRGGTGA